MFKVKKTENLTKMIEVNRKLQYFY